MAEALGVDPDHGEPDGSALPPDVVAELAWAFQDSVVEVLATKTVRAAQRHGARSIVMGGGVAANQALRARIAGGAAALGIPLVVPRPGLCTDNAAMIGAAGWRRYLAGVRAGVGPRRAPVAAAGRLMARPPAPGGDPSPSSTASTSARRPWSATCAGTA